MAEYYPLLAKAVASLPNSTPESRKLVYDRARKALIGQLRMLHPPVAEQDIERESVALDRAVERLETELAAPPPSPPPVSDLVETLPPPKPEAVPAKVAPARFPSSGGALGPTPSKPVAPLRTKLPVPKAPVKKNVPNGVAAVLPAAPPSLEAPPPPRKTTPPSEADKAPVAAAPVEAVPLVSDISTAPVQDEGAVSPAVVEGPAASEPAAKPRAELQRPIAPQPPVTKAQKRPLWIIPVGIGAVVLLVAVAAYKLRDRPETLVRAKPAEQTSDANKIADRVGSAGSKTSDDTRKSDQAAAPTPAQSAQPQKSTQPSANPAAAVAGRAALLVEAPDEANKVKTYLGTVVWRLDNVSDGQNQAVGLAVRADIDLPEDKLKATVLFQKNLDASLPASHTMKVRFIVEPGSATGSVKQINVPQMRREDNATGDALDGVTVPIVENSFLIGLSPGNSETANLDLLNSRQWIDIPMFLTNGKIAKLTFEKTDAGQRDIQEAIAAWSKP